MAVELTCTQVIKDVPSGRCYVRFNDGSIIEFNNIDEMKTYGSEMDDPGSLGYDNARKFAVRYWIARDPNASNMNFLPGKTITLDLAAVQPLKVV